ncbi:collagen binding domain-containing protein [Corynebacterium kutscheri]|uniref:collagen binding domain-containing protein n=1 Tax=Corynebacterium kutscheri TaxID=35755 RepID=UPI0037BF652F
MNIGKITNDKSTAHLNWRKLAAATPEQKAEILLGGSEWTLVPVKDGKADEKNAITIVDKTNTNEGVRDENATAGEFLVKDIEVGTYLLRETKAPAGYQISEELRNGVEVTITSDQTGTTIKLKDQYNKPITGNVIWQKIDPEKNALTGSVWTIVKVTEDHKPIAGQEAIRIEDCTEQACTGYDKDAVGGKFRVENLEFGTYKLQEVQAPAGYKLEKKEHYFTISEQGVVDAGSFVNHIGRGINLPLTGGRGSYIFILFALGISAISLISAGTFLKRRRG